MNKRKVLEERQRKLEKAEAIIEGLAKHGIDVEIEQLNEDFAKYETMLAERENSGAVEEITEEQKQVIKSLDSYYEIFLQGHNEIYYDETIRRPTIIDDRVVEFFLAVVPPHLIETQTEVIEENKRNQASLNEFNLNYILRTLRDDGQMYEAEGYIEPTTGKIKVVDGSSRRMSCILAVKPYRIMVTREVISRKQLGLRSERANDHKGSSFWEQSLEFSELKKDGLSNQEIAQAKGVQESRVSYGLGAVDEVPNELYTRFQAHTSIARTTIEWLVPKWRLMSKVDRTHEFLQNVKPFNESDAKNDAQVLSNMKRAFRKIMPEEHQPAPAKGYMQRKDYQIKHKFDHDSGKVVVNVIDASPEILAKIDSFFKEL